MLRSVRYSCRQLWRRDGEGEVRDNRDSSDAGCEMRDARCEMRDAGYAMRALNHVSRIADLVSPNAVKDYAWVTE